jgi:anti-sigma factor RsiW
MIDLETLTVGSELPARDHHPDSVALFNNAMALIGFLSSGLELPGSMASGLRDFIVAWSAAAVVYAGAVHRPVDTESAGGG